MSRFWTGSDVVVKCNDSMAPGLMHILFVHSDGLVIKEFHFLLPFQRWEEREGGRDGGREREGRLSRTFEDNSRQRRRSLIILHLWQEKSGEGNPNAHADTQSCM